MFNSSNNANGKDLDTLCQEMREIRRSLEALSEKLEAETTFKPEFVQSLKAEKSNDTKSYRS